MALPDFEPRTLDELRAWYRGGDEDMKRLILEVQHLRLALLDMGALVADATREVRLADRSLAGEGSPLGSLHSRIMREVLRAREIQRPRDPVAEVRRKVIAFRNAQGGQ